MNPDVTETVETIRKMSDILQMAAKSVDIIANQMEESGDISYAGAAINVATNLIMQLRLDLLIVRPIRAFQAADKKENRGEIK